MGTFNQTIEVLSLDGTRIEPIEALVDTGSTYLWLPQTLLESLGYQPAMSRTLVTATGEEVQRGLASVFVRLNGEMLPVPCIFGDNESRPLLGAIVLEAFSLAVDSVNRRLIPVPALATTAVGCTGRH